MNKEIVLDTLRWSFSSLNAYHICPRMFELTYIKNVQPRKQNAFALWGTFGHNLHERYYTDKCEFYELSKMYVDEYIDNVYLRFPPNKYVDLDKSYYDAGKHYFDYFEGLPDNLEVICVEQRIDVKIDGYDFCGYIDLVLRDKNDGRYIIEDHKSKSGFKNAKEQKEYARQLYLYAIYVYETYGEYPKQLVFNMFRMQDEVAIDFSFDEFLEAKSWVTNTIRLIYADELFEDKILTAYTSRGKLIEEYNKDDFFCNHLCSVREFCNRSRSCKNN